MPDAALRLTRVSQRSWWHDRVWYLTTVSAGQSDVSINWANGLTEEDWVDPCWQALVEIGRRYIDAFRANDHFKSRSDVTVGSDAQVLLYFMRWMYFNNFDRFSELSSEDFGYFLRDLVEDKLRIDEMSPSIIGDTFKKYLDVLVMIYEYSALFVGLPELGRMVISGHPFNGVPTTLVARRFSSFERGAIEAVPIEVFNPVIKTALKWLDEFFPHIYSLQEAFLRGRRAAEGVNTKNHVWYTNRAMREVVALHSVELQAALRSNEKTAFFSDAGVGLTPILRHLIDDFTGAQANVIGAEVGLRASELAGLKSLPYDVDGLPHCIETRSSFTGLFEHFFIRGFLYKGSGGEAPEMVEWLAGSRPAGSNWLPDPVRAVLALDKLYKPWREMAGSDALLVSLRKGGAMPMNLPQGSRILRDFLAGAQNRFIRNHVQLPEMLRDVWITEHGWRKRYAENIIDVDDELTPAVQAQLKHVNDAITEEAYIGNDPFLRRLVEDQVALATGRAMYDLIYGDVPTAGKIVDELSDHLPRVRIWCDQFEDEDGKRDALTQLFQRDGIRLWGSPYGNCIFRCEKARCHHLENGKFDFKATRPLQTQRCPDTCAGCSNFMVARRHTGFWRTRYELHTELFHSCRQSGLAAAATIARERAKVAWRILARLKVEIEYDKELDNE